MAGQQFSRFLLEQSAAGVVDSSGEFTVSLAEGLGKLSKFALARKNDWILKAVQASVAASGSALEVQIRRDLVQLRFQLDQPVSMEALARVIPDPAEPAGTFAGELAIGLRTLLSHHRFALMSDTGEALLWNGEQLSRAAIGPADLGGAKLLLQVSTRTLSGDMSQRTQDAAELSQALRRSRYAPLSLSLDRRPIGPLAAPLASRMAPPKHSEGSPARLLLAELDFTEGELKAGSRCPGKEAGWLSDRLKDEAPFLHCPLPARPRQLGWLELAISFQDSVLVETFISERDGERYGRDVPIRKAHREDFFVHRTRLGVICDSFKWPKLWLGGCLVMPCDSSRAGLDGLGLTASSLTEQDSYWSHLAALEPLLLELVTELKGYRPRRFWAPPWKRKEELKMWGTGTGTFGVITAGLAMTKGFGVAVMMGWPGLLMGGVLAAGVVRTRKDTSEQWDTVVLAVRDFVVELQRSGFALSRIPLDVP